MGKSKRTVKGKVVDEHDLPVQTPAERATYKAFAASRNNEKAALRRLAGAR